MENSINEVYQLDIVVLTPLHVGSGTEKDWVKGLDYVQNNGRVYHLNQKKVLELIDLSTYSSVLVNKDENLIIKKLGGNLETVSDQVYEMSVNTENDIKSFIKSGLNNKPVLPGSSLKGAIRSILFAYLKNTGQNNEQAVLGKANEGDEFMRFIKVSDTPFDKLELKNTKIFNLIEEDGAWMGGWKHSANRSDSKFNSTGFNTLYEVLPTGVSSKITLSIANKVFANYSKITRHQFGLKKDNIINKPIEFLFGIINKHTEDYIKKEIAFYNKFHNNETDSIISSFQSVLDQIPEDNSWCVLKMSAGSGFHSITGDWQFTDYIKQPGIWPDGRNQGKKKFKSRKIVTGSVNNSLTFAPMGFLKIGRKTDEEIQQERVELETRLETQKMAKEEQLKKIEMEKETRQLALKVEQERLEKLEAERLQKEADDKKIEEELREAIRLKLEAEEKARIERLAQKVEGGLSFLSNTKNFDDAKKRIDDWMKKAKVEILPESQHQYLLDAITRFYIELNTKDKKKWEEPFYSNHIWKKVSTWVTNDIAQEWYNKIIK